MAEPSASIKFSSTKLTWPDLSQCCFSFFHLSVKYERCLLIPECLCNFLITSLAFWNLFRELMLNFKIFETICHKGTFWLLFSSRSFRVWGIFWFMIDLISVYCTKVWFGFFMLISVFCLWISICAVCVKKHYPPLICLFTFVNQLTIFVSLFLDFSLSH